MPLAIEDIRGLACTLCNECWLVGPGRSFDDAVDALGLHMARTHGTARFSVEVMTDAS
ncbi:MAG: hypothetical protein ACTH0V_00425 [Microbacteriaceae bacterium]